MRDSVYQQALLYACGELDADEVADFETRLSGDQAAREALVAAVSMVAPSNPLFPGGPNPAYRARVRDRLQDSLAARQLRDRSARPWVYSLAGAAAAVFVMLLVNPPRYIQPVVETPAVTNMPPRPSALPQAQPTAETIYSDLSNVDRVLRVHDQQQHRRSRYDDIKLPHGLLEDPPSGGKGSSM